MSPSSQQSRRLFAGTLHFLLGWEAPSHIVVYMPKILTAVLLAPLFFCISHDRHQCTKNCPSHASVCVCVCVCTFLHVRFFFSHPQTQYIRALFFPVFFCSSFCGATKPTVRILLRGMLLFIFFWLWEIVLFVTRVGFCKALTIRDWDWDRDWASPLFFCIFTVFTIINAFFCYTLGLLFFDYSIFFGIHFLFSFLSLCIYTISV